VESEGLLPTVFTNPATCPYPRPDKSSPRTPSYFIKIHFTIILSSTSRSFKWSLSLRSLHQNTVRTSPRLHTCYMHRSSHSSRFDRPDNIWWWVQIIQSSLCSLHSTVTSFLLSPDIFLSTLFWNSLSLQSSLSVRNRVSHPQRTGKITVLYILIFIFFDSKVETEIFRTEG
jgi:hypothetical protein